ncbi:MAG: hypothetical protein IH795_05600 [Bacteroidetes bacterium]|nr:hypothetical protein [Bacteroidota bacterium]
MKKLFRWIFPKKTDVLFIDGNCYDCRNGEMIYYVVLSAGGKYKLGSDFAEEIHKNMDTWHLLISLSLVKGLYKNHDKAHEYCIDANAGSVKTIEKAIFTGK